MNERPYSTTICIFSLEWCKSENNQNLSEREHLWSNKVHCVTIKIKYDTKVQTKKKTFRKGKSN